MLHNVRESYIHDMVISDHSPILVTLDNLRNRPDYRQWRFPTYLNQNDSFKQMLTEAWLDYAHNNRHHENNPNLFWEAGKSFLRGKIISFTSAYRKTTQKQYLEASNRIWTAQACLNERNNAEKRKS